MLCGLGVEGTTRGKERVLRALFMRSSKQQVQEIARKVREGCQSNFGQRRSGGREQNKVRDAKQDSRLVENNRAEWPEALKHGREGNTSRQTPSSD